jgi:tripartite-type tricarboxylate transporter receptor subunit TctC
MRIRFAEALLLAGLTAGLSAAPSTLRADSVADFYQGKTLTVFVGFGPGGGYDANARLLGKHLGRFIPGNPDVIVKNMQGAGSKKLLGYFTGVGPKDGTEIGIVAAESALEPIFRKETAGLFDAAKLSWIGSLNSFTTIGIAMATSGLKTIEDAKTKPFAMASTAPGQSPSVYAKMLNDMLGTKFNIVNGYKGSAAMSLSMEQGETVGFLGWCWSCINANKPDWVKDKVVNIFIQFGRRKHPDLADVPWIFDLLKTEEDKAAARAILASLGPARPFAAAPGIPADRLAALRTAFMKMAQDPQFLADAERAKRPILPMSGEEAQGVFEEAYKTPAAVREKAAQYYK